MKLTGENRTTRGKTCPGATLATTNPTMTDTGSNPGLRGERPATNRLSHGTDFFLSYSIMKKFVFIGKTFSCAQKLYSPCILSSKYNQGAKN
jgi:hypothetical protein